MRRIKDPEEQTSTQNDPSKELESQHPQAEMPNPLDYMKIETKLSKKTSKMERE